MQSSHGEFTLAVILIIGLTALFFMIGPGFFLGNHYYAATETYYKDSYARSTSLTTATWAPANLTSLFGSSWTTPVLEEAHPFYQTALNELEAAKGPQQRTEQADNGQQISPDEYKALREAIVTRLDHARSLVNEGETAIRIAYLWHTFWALLPLAIIGTGVSLAIARRRVAPAVTDPHAVPFSTKMAIMPQPVWVRPRYGNPANVPELAAVVAPYSHDRVLMDLVRLYAAHPDCPASISHHGNVTGGLQIHIALVFQKAEQLLKISRDANPNLHPDYHQLARWVALAHDLGKIVSYERASDGQWVNNGLPHDRLSATLLSSIPSVKALPDEIRWILIRTIRYYHDKHELPIDTPVVASKLVKLMNDAEKMAGEEEKAYIEERIKVVKPAIPAALDAAFEALNVNHLKFGAPQGWVSKTHPYLFVLEWQFRETVVAHLPAAMRHELPILHREGGLSPIWHYIREELDHRQLLVRTIQEKSASHDGFYKCRVDQQLFKMVAALDLTKLPPHLVDKWKAGRAPDLYVL